MGADGSSKDMAAGPGVKRAQENGENQKAEVEGV